MTNEPLTSEAERPRGFGARPAHAKRAKATVALAAAAALVASPPLAWTAVASAAAASAASPLIRAAEVAQETFASRLSARPEALSLLDYWETVSPTAEQSKQLTSAFSRAQSLFLDGSSEDAERAFREVVKLAREADWRDAQRRALSFSFMRLAQLAAAPTLIDDRVEAAALFAPDLKPDADTFPPPLLRSWEKALARVKARSLQISASTKFPAYDVLKVDGRAYAIRRGVDVAVGPGPHRISVLSNAHPYFSHVLTGAQLQALRIDQPPLASGDCENPRLTGFETIDAASVTVVFDGCVKIHDGVGWRSEPKVLARADAGVPPLAESGGAGAPAWTAAEPPKAKPVARGWIWTTAIVTATVVGYALYRAQENRRSSDGDRPTDASGL